MKKTIQSIMIFIVLIVAVFNVSAVTNEELKKTLRFSLLNYLENPNDPTGLSKDDLKDLIVIYLITPVNGMPDLDTEIHPGRSILAIFMDAVEKEPALDKKTRNCEPGVKCKTKFHHATQATDCKWDEQTKIFCEYGCENGKCRLQPSTNSTDDTTPPIILAFNAQKTSDNNKIVIQFNSKDMESGVMTHEVRYKYDNENYWSPAGDVRRCNNSITCHSTIFFEYAPNHQNIEFLGISRNYAQLESTKQVAVRFENVSNQTNDPTPPIIDYFGYTNASEPGTNPLLEKKTINLGTHEDESLISNITFYYKYNDQGSYNVIRDLPRIPCLRQHQCETRFNFTVNTNNTKITFKAVVKNTASLEKIAYLNLSWGNTPPQNQTNTCTDSDGGQTYLIKGKTTGMQYNDPYESWDECQNDNRLMERYCMGNTNTFGYYECTSIGKVCSDGKCVNTTPPQNQTDYCYDTDGQDYYHFGQVTFRLGNNPPGSNQDTCRSSNGLVEYYCINTTLAEISFTCPTGYACTGGRCAVSNQSNCTNQCSPVGAASCNGVYARTCGNYDVDSCLEWNDGTYCQYGCSNGYCFQTANNTCTDSDGGQNYITKGVVTGLYYEDPYEAWDECQTPDSNFIREQYCINSQHSFIYYDCANVSKICNDGRCVSIPNNQTNIPYCNDSDSGTNLLVFGHISGRTETNEYNLYDQCNPEGSISITERFCTQNRPNLTTTTCPGNTTCVNGACHQ